MMKVMRREGRRENGEGRIYEEETKYDRQEEKDKD